MFFTTPDRLKTYCAVRLTPFPTPNAHVFSFNLVISTPCLGCLHSLIPFTMLDYSIVPRKGDFPSWPSQQAQICNFSKSKSASNSWNGPILITVNTVIKLEILAVLAVCVGFSTNGVHGCTLHFQKLLFAWRNHCKKDTLFWDAVKSFIFALYHPSIWWQCATWISISVEFWT